MKHFNLLFSFLLVGIMLLSSSDTKLYANPVTVDEPETYTFVCDNNFPPYNYEVDGQEVGFCVDLINRIAELMNFNVNIISGPWEKVRNMVENGKADGVLAMYYSEERDVALDFSIPHSTAVYAIFVHDHSPVFAKKDLIDKSIIVQSGDIMHDYLLNNHITDKIIPVENPEDAILLLSHEIYDCALLGKLQGDYLANKYRLRNIKTLNDYFPPHEFCFAVYRNPELLNLLNEGLIILQNNGEHKQIYQKWLETTDKNELIMSRWFKHVVIVALVLVMIVIVSMFWIWYLRRVVSSRTRELQVEIQNKKQIEEALRASEENFRSLAENAFDGILINDENGNYLYANSNVAEISGYSVSSLTKLSIKDLTPEDDYQKVLNLSIDRIKGRPVRRVYESFLQRKDGTIIPIEVAASKTLWHNKPADMVFIRDISFRKQMEKAVANSETNFRQIVEKSSNAIYVRQDDLFVLVNPALERLLEYNSEELLDKKFDFLKIIEKDSKEFIRERIEKRRKRKLINKQFQFTARIKSGKILELEVNTSKIFWNGRPASLGIIRDLTRSKRIQEESFKAEKLDSIGVLAGGIAHDFNNILSIMLGNVQLMKIKIDAGEDIGKFLNRLEETITRATGLTQQLLTFSKGGEPVVEVASIKDLIEELVPFTLTGSNVISEITTEDDLHLVEMDQNQISQVLTNIIINAKQAMPSGGTIYVDAMNVIVESGDLIGKLEAGEYVKISIRDEGIGIPEKIIDKIFDPFFTTKSSGSGLGLATCYSIIQKHKGYITVNSVRGEGATFTIYLPKTDKKLAEKPEIKLNKSFSGRILLMDDEEAVREFVTALLVELGFSVDATADGDSAIEQYKSTFNSGDGYSLVILDLTIPGGKGGSEVLSELRKINPDVKALAYSGYADDPVISHPRDYGFKASISKPFDLDKFAAVLSNILN